MHYQIIKQVPALLLNYHPKGTMKLPFLGEIEYYQHRFNDSFIIRKTVSTVDYSSDELEILDKLFVLPHPGLLKVISYQELAKDRFEIFFEGIQGNLQDDLLTRNKLSKNYTDSQLIEMLKNLSGALAHLEKHYIPHKQVTLEAILVTSNGEAKLVHPLLVGSRIPTYNKILQGYNDKDLKFLPPEVVDCLMDRKLFPDTDPFKEDIYSLGVCFLEASKVRYRMGSMSPGKDRLNDAGAVKITQIIHRMVEERPILRIDAASLNKMLGFSQEITRYTSHAQEDNYVSDRLATEESNLNTYRRNSPQGRRSWRSERGNEEPINFSSQDIDSAILMAEKIMKTDLSNVREILEQSRSTIRDNSLNYTTRKSARSPSPGHRRYESYRYI